MIDATNFKKELSYYLSTRDSINNKLSVMGIVEDHEKELFSFELQNNEYVFSYIGQQVSLAEDNQLIDLIYKIIWEANNKDRDAKCIKKTNNEQKKTDSDLFQYQSLAKTLWEYCILPLTWLHSALKWLIRFFILDSFISKYTIGNIISTVANSHNPHYKTEPQTLTETLKALIFPAGSKKPQISVEGNIRLDSVLTALYQSAYEFKHEYVKGDQKIKFKDYRVALDEQTEIAGVTASNSLVTQDQEHLHVIYFNGNNGSYQMSASKIGQDLLAYEQVGIAITACGFNYPGVLNSSGEVMRAQDLIQAGIAQVERLHQEKKIPYHLIGLDTISLGAAVGIHVASYYRSRGISLAGTYAAKTFSSTTNVALDYVSRIPYVGGFFSLVLRLTLVLDFGLWATGWQLNTAGHFSSLPENERAYSVVRSHKGIREKLNPHDDKVIGHDASLHESWRLKLVRKFHKWGLLGYKPEEYGKVKSAPKMMVVNKKDQNQLVVEPEICGHSQAYSYEVIGSALYHRGESSPLMSETNELLTDTGFEAGSAARQFFSDPSSRQEVNDNCAANFIKETFGLLK